MIALKSIIEKLQKELPYLKSEFFVKKIGVFGSIARNEATNQSDIDILVDFSKPVGFIIFMNLRDYLSEKLKNKVDLVTPDAIKPIMREDIFEDLIYA